MDKIDWLILDALSADWETMPTIYHMVRADAPEVTREDIAERLQALYQKGHVQIQEAIPFDKQAILAEPDEYWDTDYWFGLTEAGGDEWADYSLEFGDFEVDWSDACPTCFDYVNNAGYVHGLDPVLCTEVVQEQAARDGITIDVNSFNVNKVAGFNAQYYKPISGGVRIDFRFTGKPHDPREKTRESSEQEGRA